MTGRLGRVIAKQYLCSRAKQQNAAVAQRPQLGKKTTAIKAATAENVKKLTLIWAILCMTAIAAMGQNHIERAMRRAREQREAMAARTVVSEDGEGKSGYLTYKVENGDTTYFDSLDPVWIWGRGKGKMSEKDWKKYYKTVWRFARVYPYALAAGRLQEIVDSTITAGNYGRMKKDRYIAQVQKELFVDFESGLRKMTISQGAILLKLIDRETGQSPYTIIKEYKSGAAAGFWNGIAHLFDNDMRTNYDPEGEDKDLEELCQRWADGTFRELYWSIFWEEPPKVDIPAYYFK